MYVVKWESCIIDLQIWDTVILQNFSVVLFSVISVVNGFTEIKKTPKMKKIHGVIAVATADTEI